VNASTNRGSISSESTLTEDTCDRDLLNNQLLAHSEKVGKHLRKMGARAKTVSVKIKHTDFKLITRSITLKAPTQSTVTIFNESKKLLNAYPGNRGIRLIGVGVSGFIRQDMPLQKSLFEDDDASASNWDKVDKVVDDITEKYGTQSLTRGSRSKKNED
jgi:DNA polymerase-4